MEATISAEKVTKTSFRIFLPGNFVKIVHSLGELARMLNPYWVYEDRYAKFESELLRKGKASATVPFGKGWQVLPY